MGLFPLSVVCGVAVAVAARTRKKKVVHWASLICLCGWITRDPTFLNDDASREAIMLQEPTRFRHKEQRSATVAKVTPNFNAAYEESTSLLTSSLSSHSFLSSLNMTREDLYERNYFYRAWMTNLETDDSLNPHRTSRHHHILPMEAMTRYISEHSHQQLELEWNEACLLEQQHKEATSTQSVCRLDGAKSPRKYMVASYSCPLESGNRMHRFMNGLLWAILTNRTFLWRYQNYDVCEEYNETDCAAHYNQRVIKGPSDCEGLLERSPWIPSYDEWKDKLGFSADNSDLVRAQAAKNRLKKKQFIDDTTLPYDGIFVGVHASKQSNTNIENATTASAESSDGNNTSTVFNNDAIRVMRSGDQNLLNPGEILTENFVNSSIHLIKAENVERLESIRSKGPYFLYGMLFESLFTMDRSLEPPEELLIKKNAVGAAPTNPENTFDGETISIFLHSRHPGTWPESYIKPDCLCLERMLTAFYSISTDDEKQEALTGKTLTPCHIYVMSDRPTAARLLHEVIQNSTHCTSSSRMQTNDASLPPKGDLSSRYLRTKRGEKSKFNTNLQKSLSFRLEHGPRAGRGFWEDVSLAMRARDGMISVHQHHRSSGLARTSTALVREIVEFRRTLEHYYTDIFGRGQNYHRELPEFFECLNPSREEEWKEVDMNKQKGNRNKKSTRRKRRNARGNKIDI
jgi:hypothetical protein